MRRPRRETGPTGPRNQRLRDIAVVVAVVGTVAGACLPILATGERLADNDDFLNDAARHETLRLAQDELRERAPDPIRKRLQLYETGKPYRLPAREEK